MKLRTILPLTVLVLLTAGCGSTSAAVAPVAATSAPAATPAAAAGAAAVGGAAPSGPVGATVAPTPATSRAPLAGGGSFNYASPGLHLLVSAPASGKTALVRSVNAYRAEVGAGRLLLVSVDVDNRTRSPFALRGFALRLLTGKSVALGPLSAYVGSWVAAAKGHGTGPVLADGTRLLSQVPNSVPAGHSGTLLLATHVDVPAIDGVTYEQPGGVRPIALIPHWLWIR